MVSLFFIFLSCRLVTNKLLLGVIILMELAILGAVIYLKFFRKWNYTCLNGVNALDPGQTQTLSICLHWLSSSNNFFLLFSANRFCKYKNGRKDSVLKWTFTKRGFCPCEGDLILNLSMDQTYRDSLDKLAEICTVLSDCYCQWCPAGWVFWTCVGCYRPQSWFSERTGKESTKTWV